MATIYLQKCTYLLRTHGSLFEGLQLTHEIFTGTPIINNLTTLEQILLSRGGRRLWLITSSEFMGDHLQKPILSDEIVQFLEDNSDRVVFIAEDNITKVYLWDSVGFS